MINREIACLCSGKIISETGDLSLDTGTLTHQNFEGSKGYKGFQVSVGIDVAGGGQQPTELMGWMPPPAGISV